jgi:drug/metabolite transporter (DMT)-like permease
MSLAGAALVAAESILALTPVAIKKTPLDPTAAVWSRVLSSAILGYGLAGDRSLPRKEWAGAAGLGYMNLLHIASSYESFRHLPAGQAMSLLYTYPLWNLVFNNLFHDEKISMREYGLMMLAAGGSILLNLDPGHAEPAAQGPSPNAAWGVLMGLIMALTESGMHVLLRILGWRDPAKSVWVVNSSAGAWLAGVSGLQRMLGPTGAGSGTWWDAGLLTLFHSISMFSGYWLRFFAVPRLSTVTYSILSYAGLLASYLFGLAFLGERPGWMSLIGAAVILVSGVLLQMK